MAPPSSLKIQSSSLIRLVTEHKAYETEVIKQKDSLTKLQEEFDNWGTKRDENAEFRLNQEVELNP